MISIHKRFSLPDRSYMNMVKKEISSFAGTGRLSVSRKGELDIVLSEMVTNVIKHSGSQAEILVRIEEGKDIEIICIDKGVGISNIPQVMKDGFSTLGTLGHGLGTIQRLSDEFDIYSLENWGTIVLSRFLLAELHFRETEGNRIKCITVPKENEQFCGDRWSYKRNGDKFDILVVDGLGHGKEAQKAAEFIENFFLESKLSGTNFLKEAHFRLTRTRGVVAAFITVNFSKQQLFYTGVGNILCRILSRTGIVNALSYNGIIGHSFPVSLKSSSYTLIPGDRIIICSDGIISRWDAGKFSDVFMHDGIMAAACIYKDFNRNNDDTLVMVIKI